MAKAQQGKDIASKILIWVPLVIILLSMIIGILLRSSVDEVAEDSTEIVNTTNYVDSAASLKTIIVTLNNQYVKAENNWSQVLSIVLFLLFVVSVIAVIQWVRLYQIDRLQQKKNSKSATKDS
ncbi:hypothetical protein [Motiliproteus sp. MSK22-1]|uniref:hypothetical protein n=1 Tax=Motiliproteus sp. MSK22-1 TaxID=1897630 RepID=UPI0009782DE8|nr:hypothetical protein [Motiliproteus sp. MSK22-1]OMH25905.1 hypothetical protein BGP75_25690 [Motiliproteus sp. MSK22-1]